MLNILTVVGARPQFVKAAALSRAFLQHKNIKETLVHTGQHFDENMSAIFFEEMEIPTPKYNLQIHALSHGAMTGKMLEEVEKVLFVEKPDLLLVYGDTNSTLAGALAAKKLDVKVAHVEAGLRSFNMQMPEEVNRILTDRISDFLFCPTQVAVDNLTAEGYGKLDVEVILSGDVMQDVANYYASSSAQKAVATKHFEKDAFILCTLHRAENTNDPDRLTQIVAALNEISNTIEVVLPLHPGTKKKIQQLGVPLRAHVMDPVGYFDMIELLKKCRMVMTDSGGLQKEAFFFKKNCVTMRDQTEWVELVKGDVNILVGADRQKIITGTEAMLSRVSDFSMELYGDGKACNRICEKLLKLA